MPKMHYMFLWKLSTKKKNEKNDYERVDLEHESETL